MLKIKERLSKLSWSKIILIGTGFFSMAQVFSGCVNHMANGQLFLFQVDPAKERLHTQGRCPRSSDELVLENGVPDSNIYFTNASPTDCTITSILYVWGPISERSTLQLRLSHGQVFQTESSSGLIWYPRFVQQEQDSGEAKRGGK